MTKARFSRRIENLLDDPAGTAWEIQSEAVVRADAGEDILFLTIGDPDFRTPPPIAAKAVEAITAGRTRYSPVGGETMLQDAVARYQSRHSRNPVASENVAIFPGAQNALFNAVQAIAGEGDEIIVPEPFYATYPGVVAASGATMKTAPCDPNDAFAIRADIIASRIGSRTRAVLINSPGNPSGAVLSREELARIVALCRDHGLWLISDEVYERFVFEGDHVPAWDFADRHDRTIVVNSVSKSLAMAGWRMGWSIGPIDFTRNIATLAAAQLFGSPQFIQDSVAWALDQDLEATRAMRDTYRERRDLALAALDGIEGLSCAAPAGGMFLFVDVSRIMEDGRQFAFALLREKGVAVVPGYGFGDSARPFVRISLTQPVETLRDAFARIAAFAAARAARQA